MKSRDEILAKAAELSSSEEGSVEMEEYLILLEIAGKDETSMMNAEKAEGLLHLKDIYHYQYEAVRMIRNFLFN